MSLRLAFDLDGVFADLGAHLSQNGHAEAVPDHPSDAAAPTQTETETDTEKPPEVTAPAAELPFSTTHLRGASRRVWSRLSAVENFWETLNEIEEGSVQRLATLTRERRWEVIFLTSRPDTIGDSVQVQSQRWLEQKGFALPSVFVTRRSRGKIASALSLDLVIDDNPENCLDITLESEARAILVWRGDAETVPASARRLGIGSVSSVAECLRVVEEVDRAQHRGSRVRDVFRRLLKISGVAAGDR